MDTVPNEVLVLMLSHLANKDLLKCRLVNQMWKENASHICRRKGIRLMLKRADLNTTVSDNLQAIFQTFLYLDNLPWSNCCLGSWRHTRNRNAESLNPEEIKKFVERFGSHLRGLKCFGDNFKIFMEILPGLQNLEVLTSRVESVTDKIHQIQPSLEIKALKKLKIFQSRVSASSDVQFIQAIIDSIPNLTQIDDFVLNITSQPNSWENVNQCKQLASLLATVPSKIILTLQTSNLTSRSPLLRTLAVKNLNVQDLAIFVEDVESKDSGYFAPMEEFLASIAPSLAELDVVDKREFESNEFPIFTIPALPALKQLKLLGDNSHLGPTFPYLSCFMANQFPKLDKVQIVNVYGHQFQGFNTCSLGSVRVLEFFDEEEDKEEEGIPLGGGDDFNSKPWKKIFPNLETLKAEIWDQESLQYIFNHMTNVTNLSLRILVGRIDHLEKVLNGTLKEYSFNTPRSNGIQGSLHSMIKLTSLNMNFLTEDDYRISDKFVENTLLKIRPLEALTIIAKVSRKSAAKLRSYHQRVELTRIADYDYDEEHDHSEDDESEENSEVDEESDEDGVEYEENDDHFEEDVGDSEEDDEGEENCNRSEGSDD